MGGSTIGIILFVAVVVMGMISNYRKEQQRQEALRLRREKTAANPHGETTRAKLDDLADRRRRELQERMLKSQDSSSASSSEPGNLTMGQLEARQRARTLYEQRAEALRRVGGQVAAAGQPIPAARPPLQTKPIPQAQRATKPVPRRAAQPMAPSRSSRRTSTPTALPRRREPELLAQPDVIEERQSSILPPHTTVSKSRGPNVAISGLGEAPLGERKFSLRDALIYREILDKPVGDRTMDEHPHAWSA